MPCRLLVGGQGDAALGLLGLGLGGGRGLLALLGGLGGGLGLGLGGLGLLLIGGRGGLGLGGLLLGLGGRGTALGADGGEDLLDLGCRNVLVQHEAGHAGHLGHELRVVSGGLDKPESVPIDHDVAADLEGHRHLHDGLADGCNRPEIGDPLADQVLGGDEPLGGLDQHLVRGAHAGRGEQVLLGLAALGLGLGVGRPDAGHIRGQGGLDLLLEPGVPGGVDLTAAEPHVDLARLKDPRPADAVLGRDELGALALGLQHRAVRHDGGVGVEHGEDADARGVHDQAVTQVVRLVGGPVVGHLDRHDEPRVEAVGHVGGHLALAGLDDLAGDVHADDIARRVDGRVLDLEGVELGLDLLAVLQRSIDLARAGAAVGRAPLADLARHGLDLAELLGELGGGPLEADIHDHVGVLFSIVPTVRAELVLDLLAGEQRHRAEVQAAVGPVQVATIGVDELELAAGGHLDLATRDPDPDLRTLAGLLLGLGLDDRRGRGGGGRHGGGRRRAERRDVVGDEGLGLDGLAGQLVDGLLHGLGDHNAEGLEDLRHGGAHGEHRPGILGADSVDADDELAPHRGKLDLELLHLDALGLVLSGHSNTSI